MRNLHIDIETYSSIDIGKAGAFRYAQSEDFEILLFAYKEDEKPVCVVDLAHGEKIPERIYLALIAPQVVKYAYNAAFEWYCLRCCGVPTPIEQWRCTMIHGLYCGYPAGLKAVGEAMGIAQDKQKLKTGEALIRYFCKPCRATKSNGGRKRNLPWHDEERWELFKEYNARDVEAEYEIEKHLAAFPVPGSVWQEWRDDIVMNARGVRIDHQLVQGALFIDAQITRELQEEAQTITGLDNPNSRAQLLTWIQERLPEVEDLKGETVESLLKEDLPEDVRRVLEIRQQLGKTSVSKYAAMEAAKGPDDRVRGLLQFYGANRTGRWAGRLVQVQNLPRNYMGSLDAARRLTKSGNYEALKAIYGNVPDTLSQLIRTAFIPSEGNRFIVSDFSAIEARVIVWLARELWAQEVFDTHGKIYEATAAQMFHVPVESIAKGKENYDLRQKGKVATLALGYQGGVNALIAMGALRMGIDEEELPEIVMRWRKANPMIELLWHRVEEAALDTVRTGRENVVDRAGIFRLESDLRYGQVFLTIELPSGRKLYYCRPEIGENRWGQMKSIHYMGVDQTKKKWRRLETYGGKLVENITQAVARDCLAITLQRVINAGYTPVMHIHDEIVIDATPEQKLEDVNAIFSEPIPWAPKLTLKGAGFESPYYMKD